MYTLNNGTDEHASVWKCFSCGKANESSDCFCVNCGTKNESKWFCSGCGQVNDRSDSFCIACGKKRVIYSDTKETMMSEQIKQKNKNLKTAFIIVFIVFILTTGIFCIFTQGLTNNILITLASCVFPVAIGIGFNSLGNAFRNSNGMRRFLHIFGSVFRCVCPIILMVVLYYTLPHTFTRYMAIIIALSISFLGYIPAYYDQKHSLMKNNILGIIKLFSIIFMWSFICCNVGIADAFAYAQNVAQRSLEFGRTDLRYCLRMGIIFLCSSTQVD